MNLDIYRILAEAAQEQLHGHMPEDYLPSLPGRAPTPTGNPAPVVDERSHLMGFLDAIAWLSDCNYLDLETIAQGCTLPSAHQATHATALLTYSTALEHTPDQEQEM